MMQGCIFWFCQIPEFCPFASSQYAYNILQ